MSQPDIMSALGFSETRVAPKDYPKDNIELLATAKQRQSLFEIPAKVKSLADISVYKSNVRSPKHTAWADHVLACAKEYQKRLPKSSSVS